MFNEKNIDKIERKKEIKDEIKELKRKRNSLKLQDLKTSTVKNLKISLRGLQLLAPYVLTTSIMTGVFVSLNGLPFYRDKTKKYANVMLDVDSLGNVNKYKLEPYGEKFDDDENKIYYYFKEEDNEMPLYSVETSQIGNMTYEDVMKLEENLEKIYKLNLGESISVSREPIYNLAYEKLQDEAITRAVIYYEDKTDYVVGRETKNENTLCSILYIMDELSIIYIMYLIRKKKKKSEFFDYVDEIKKKCQPANKDNITKLTKKLELKKDEYNRLKK